MGKKCWLALCVLTAPALWLAGCDATRDEVEVPLGEAKDVLGEVQFPVSCDESVQTEFNNAVATLHSFEFDEARGLFEDVAVKDPSCAMAFWGVAMTYYHPLWAPPTPSDLEAGQAAVDKATGLDASDREKRYIEAIASFYHEADTVPHRDRAVRYAEAMATVHEENPEDREAEIFYALALLSNADPRDKTYAVQKRTGAMLEPLFAEMPNHPGLAHYIIHSYDYPPLAEKAVDAAHRYLEIARSLPHALHMSGHIFTQRGMWEESIDANTRSAEAARARRDSAPGQSQVNETHALDYLVYAYLQRGQDAEAKAIVDDLDARPDLNWRHGVVSFNAGAVPVRYAVERQDWQAASQLPSFEVADEEDVGYETRVSVALRHWARAIGAARSGQTELAEAELGEVGKLAEELSSSENVWAKNTSEALRLEAAAWLSLANHQPEQALELLQAAAALEDETDKSGLSPGRALPVHEQLGDLLLELDRPGEALAEYETSLQQACRRFRSFVGAARAASAAEKTGVARDYYQRLVDLAASDSTRAEIQEAKEYLGGAAS